ncbi:hypothetical protein IWQ56_006469, partial [Coemansia nantahalensis]
ARPGARRLPRPRHLPRQGRDGPCQARRDPRLARAAQGGRRPPHRQATHGPDARHRALCVHRRGPRRDGRAQGRTARSTCSAAVRPGQAQARHDGRVRVRHRRGAPAGGRDGLAPRCVP